VGADEAGAARDQGSLRSRLVGQSTAMVATGTAIMGV
jgi:hypothetical protein